MAGLSPFLVRALVAAFLGTAVMTLSSTTEMHLRGRPESVTPGRAGNRLLALFGVPERTGSGLRLLGTWVHWTYGTAWGVIFWALMDPELAGLDLAAAGPVFFVLVWGAALAGLPWTGLAPPFWRWGAKEVAIDAWHHLTYAAGTVLGWWLIGRAA